MGCIAGLSNNFERGGASVKERWRKGDMPPLLLQKLGFGRMPLEAIKHEQIVHYDIISSLIIKRRSPEPNPPGSALDCVCLGSVEEAIKAKLRDTKID